MLNSFLRKLNEPFPDRTTYQENILDILGVGVFITLFLYYFSPMEIDTYQGNRFLLCCAFGVVTILVSFAFDFFLLKILKVERDLPSWTFKKWIFSIIGLITSIALANYLLITYLSNGIFINIESLFTTIIGTWVVAIFPVVFSGVVIQLRNYKANQIHAANISTTLPSNTPPSKKISIFSQNKKNQFEVNLPDLLFVEAMQNYVSLYFLKENKVQKEVIRTTLSNVEQQLSDTPIIRCHRSFLVNPNQIRKVEGNAQGLRLTLHQNENNLIPVSRKYIPALKAYR